MTLPLLLSVPHAGLGVPESVRELCTLSPEDIARDGDEGARQIYVMDVSEIVGQTVPKTN